MKGRISKIKAINQKKCITSPNLITEKDNDQPSIIFLSQENNLKYLSHQLSPRSEDKTNIVTSINNQYKKHLSLVQIHQQRMIKFIQEHKQNLRQIQEKNEEKKAQIFLRQQRAIANKQYLIKKKSFRAQAFISKWKNSLEISKNRYEQDHKESKEKINEWARKCSNSLLNKQYDNQQTSLIIKNHFDKQTKNLRQSPSQSVSQRSSQNPESRQKNSKKSTDCLRKYSSASQRYRKTSIENATRRKQIQQAKLQKQLFNAVQKASRIKQARAIKGYLQMQKIKRLTQNQNKVKQAQRINITKLKRKKQQQNKHLEKKFKQNRAKMRDISLPIIKNIKNRQLLQNAQHYQQMQQFKINYNKIVKQKLQKCLKKSKKQK